ncbi:MAG: LptE family protein [Planctomycetota bacterium]
MRATRCAAALAAACLLTIGLTGCPYGTSSGLPEHIRTVRVTTFENDTFYRGLEGRLTRALIDKLVQDPRVRVVREGADSRLTGAIMEVEKQVLRESRNDEPIEIRLTVVARVTFEDEVQGVKLLDNQRIHSSAASSAAGVYDLERGEDRSEAEAKAIEELAAEIVRRTVGMW